MQVGGQYPGGQRIAGLLQHGARRAVARGVIVNAMMEQHAELHAGQQRQSAEGAQVQWAAA